MSPHPAREREFTMRFTSTPRGARLARRLVSHRLNDWGHPYPTPVNETLTLITAELTANAVQHGHVPGRDFHVRLTLTEGVLRVEVTDTRGEQRPPSSAPAAPDAASESGRGLFHVAALADEWGVTPRPTAPGKTVWAELRVRPEGRPHTDPPAPHPADAASVTTDLWHHYGRTRAEQDRAVPDIFHWIGVRTAAPAPRCWAT
ncbi:ATP-binding protein [Streptomyces ziwulingensis]|uniref:ATP-binding protein n=1 Tax=Streptomyces ziwulingensis TaxID=1045501 RepID=A0ABP9B0B7_9ACTN